MFEDADSDVSNDSDSMETEAAELEIDDIAADDIAGYRDLLAEISGEQFLELTYNFLIGRSAFPPTSASDLYFHWQVNVQN